MKRIGKIIAVFIFIGMFLVGFIVVLFMLLIEALWQYLPRRYKMKYLTGKWPEEVTSEYIKNSLTSMDHDIQFTENVGILSFRNEMIQKRNRLETLALEYGFITVRYER
jgi:hypothetical protein